MPQPYVVNVEKKQWRILAIMSGCGLEDKLLSSGFAKLSIYVKIIGLDEI